MGLTLVLAIRKGGAKSFHPLKGGGVPNVLTGLRGGGGHLTNFFSVLHCNTVQTLIDHINKCAFARGKGAANTAENRCYKCS